MRLYCYGESQNGVGYTPDMLTINCANGKRRVYDIQGDVDYDADKLNCRCKGDLFIANDEENDYFEMTDKQVKELVKLLKNPKNEIIITIYPGTEQEEKENLANLIHEDLLTNCEATLMICTKKKDYEVDFKFTTECYYE